MWLPFVVTGALSFLAGFGIAAIRASAGQASRDEERDAYWREKFEQVDKLNAEDVARLKTEHTKELIRARAKRKL